MQGIRQIVMRNAILGNCLKIDRPMHKIKTPPKDSKKLPNRSVFGSLIQTSFNRLCVMEVALFCACCSYCLQVEISPVLNAVETVESKNKELDRIITRLASDRTQSINPLSMILNGIIDAAVMGGIAKYEEVSIYSSSPLTVLLILLSPEG